MTDIGTDNETEIYTDAQHHHGDNKLLGYAKWIVGRGPEPGRVRDDESGRGESEPSTMELDLAQAVDVEERQEMRWEMERRDPPSRRRLLDKWGWYESRPSGAWSTTRQAEALNLATTRQPVEHGGLIFGRNLLGAAVVNIDQFELYRQRVIDGVNMVRIGDIGSAKSSGMKTGGLRQLILGRQWIAFDKKLQGDRGEYAPIADELGVESVVFRAGGGGASLNLLDSEISLDGSHDEGVDGVVPAGQELLLLAVLRDSLERPLNPREKAAVRLALRTVSARAKAAGTEPRLSDVSAQLLNGNQGHSAQALEYVCRGEDLPASVREDLGDFGYYGPRWASRALEWGLEPGQAIDELVGGALRGLVDQPTSPEVKHALNHPFVHFDLSALPQDGQGLRVVLTVAQTWMANRLASRAKSRMQTIASYEEGWHLAEGSTGEIARQNMKLSRGLGFSTDSAFHHLSDHPKDSPARALMQESDIAMLYRQGREDDAAEVTKMFHLPAETKDLLMQIGRGQCLVWMKGRDPILTQHERSTWEQGLTNTDAVLEGIAQ